MTTWAAGRCVFPQVAFRRLFEPLSRPVPADAEIVTAYTNGQVTLRSNRRLDGYHEAADLSGFQGVRAGDFVVHGLDILRGSVGVSDSDGAISAVCTVCAPRSDLDPRFFAYAMRAQAFSGFPRAMARGIREGGADFRRWETLGELPLPLPPLELQTRLADVLDRETARIDMLISLRRRQVTLLKEAAAAKRASVVLRGLNPVTGEGSLPMGWRAPLFGVVVELHRGIDLPLESRGTGLVPVISSGGFSGTHSVAAVEAPGVVTGRYGTIGEVYFVDEPYWPLNTTLYVSDFRRNDPRWVYHLIAALPLSIDAEKSAVTGINRNVVGQLRAVRPGLDEQRRIAAELDDHRRIVEDTVQAAERQSDLLSERRQALITAAVTGELGITGVAA